MKSWRTTVGGILLGVGTPLAAAGEGIYKIIGVALSTAGGLIIGVAARDNKVTSEQAGAAPEPPKP